MKGILQEKSCKNAIIGTEPGNNTQGNKQSESEEENNGGLIMNLAEVAKTRCGKEIKDCTNEELYYSLLEMTKGMAKDKVSNDGKKKL